MSHLGQMAGVLSRRSKVQLDRGLIRERVPVQYAIHQYRDFRAWNATSPTIGRFR